MRKAVEQLIESYQVFIVASAPSYDPLYINKVEEWMENYVSTPAYNRLVFTNRPGLLYGDYFVTPVPDKTFMGTTIQFGSDVFKTWEDVITFFERITV